MPSQTVEQAEPAPDNSESSVSAEENEQQVESVQEEVLPIVNEDLAATREEDREEKSEEKPNGHQPQQTDVEVKERSLSFLETLQSSLAAAQSSHEPVWKPDPPPPPLFDDFENDDDWLN